MKINYTILFFCLLICGSCDIINPDETVPVIVKVDGATLTTTAGQGANTHAIEDVWAFSNGFLGVFPIPSDIPVLESGEINVLLRPGIRPNGRAAVSIPYLHYQVIDEDLNLAPNDRIDLPIQTRYRDETKFSFVEDFESDVRFFTLDLDTIPGGLGRTEMDVRSGGFSGKMELSSSQPEVSVSTNVFTDILEAERSIFLEVDYKNEEFVTFSYIYHTPDGPRLPAVEILTLNKRDDWNKIYFDLSDIISLQAVENVIGVRIVISSRLVSEESATILLDNIKLLYE